MAADDAEAEVDPSGQPPAEPEKFMIRVGWRLNDIDYPICLDKFIMDYFDTLYNETGFSRQFTRPFHSPKFELEVSNQIVPCEQDYEFIIR
jgi:hypothetical protein